MNLLSYENTLSTEFLASARARHSGLSFKAEQTPAVEVGRADVRHADQSLLQGGVHLQLGPRPRGLSNAAQVLLLLIIIMLRGRATPG